MIIIISFYNTKDWIAVRTSYMSFSLVRTRFCHGGYVFATQIMAWLGLVGGGPFWSKYTYFMSIVYNGYAYRSNIYYGWRMNRQTCKELSVKYISWLVKIWFMIETSQLISLKDSSHLKSGIKSLALVTFFGCMTVFILILKSWPASVRYWDELIRTGSTGPEDGQLAFTTQPG